MARDGEGDSHHLVNTGFNFCGGVLELEIKPEKGSSFG